jgi:hypothetical protein
VRLDVFGRFQIDLVRVQDRWQAARVGQGLAAPLDVTIPPELDEEQAIRFLEDLWHEQADPGRCIKRITG